MVVLMAKIVSVRVENDLYDQLKAAAYANRQDFSEFLRGCLRVGVGTPLDRIAIKEGKFAAMRDLHQMLAEWWHDD